MPIYEYRCDGCATTFEALVPAGRADSAVCASCQGTSVRRLLSVFSAPRAKGSDGAAAPVGGCCGGACSAGCR